MPFVSLGAAARGLRRRLALGLLVLLLATLPLAGAAATPADIHPIFLPAVMAAPRAAGLPFDPYARRTGEGTFYAATGAGNCSFPATPNDLMVGAMNNADYADSIYCGAYVEVTGPKGAVTVRIVDRCPECLPGDIDLSREAFALIADPIAGRVPISWRILSPPLNGPIRYHFKDGSNQWWTAVQIRNHRNPIFKLEYWDAADSQFKALPRFNYNFFIKENGLGPGPYTLRVTDIYGRTLTDSGVPLLDNAGWNGSAQFPSP
ncbi:MAG TPA: expansin EXLX1 family cellulose-binding protein [Herpetosiphonaceae bacterium]|nr:expansin EXLX1 family cellulose-binding protein [Herpetosiphonaceae bacterium]